MAAGRQVGLMQCAVLAAISGVPGDLTDGCSITDSSPSPAAPNPPLALPLRQHPSHPPDHSSRKRRRILTEQVTDIASPQMRCGLVYVAGMGDGAI